MRYARLAAQVDESGQGLGGSRCNEQGDPAVGGTFSPTNPGSSENCQGTQFPSESCCGQSSGSGVRAACRDWLKLISLTSWPITGAGSVAFSGENPKSPSKL